MNREILKLLERLASEPSTPVVRRLRGLLASPEAEITDALSGATPMEEVESVWQARQKIARAQQRLFLGLAPLLQILQASERGRLIRVASVRDEKSTGTLFFDANTNDFLGAVVVTMSEHTSAYFRGELPSDPFASESALAKSA